MQVTEQLNSKKSTHFTHYRFYPWIVICLCAFFLFYKYILQVSPSVITAQLMQEFKISGVGLGNLAATYFYSYLVMQLFVGVLLDKYSPRLLTAISIAVCAAATYFFATTQDVTIAAIARTLIGIGTAFATVSYMKMATIWFRADQFAFVGGLLATAAMGGAVFGQAPLSLLIDHIGWRQSFILISILGFIIAGAFYLIARDRNENPGKVTSLEQTNHHFNLKEVLEVFRNKQNWLLTFYTGLTFSPVAVFGGLWGNPFLVAKYNISTTEAASFISLIFIGLGIGSPIFGLISDRLGKRCAVMMIGTIIALLALFPAIYFNDLPKWLLAACLFMFGFSASVFMLGFALGRELNNIALAATVVALINTGDAVLGAISEPLIGKFLDITWTGKIVNGVHYFSLHNYKIALSLLTLYLFIAIILLFFTRDASPNK